MGNVMNAPEILHIKNEEEGLEVIVTELFIETGTDSTVRYMMRFRDTDSGNLISTMFFPDRKYAMHYARSIIKGTKP
jgi:hypothetical protein